MNYRTALGQAWIDHDLSIVGDRAVTAQYLAARRPENDMNTDPGADGSNDTDFDDDGYGGVYDPFALNLTIDGNRVGTVSGLDALAFGSLARDLDRAKQLAATSSGGSRIGPMMLVRADGVAVPNTLENFRNLDGSGASGSGAPGVERLSAAEITASNAVMAANQRIGAINNPDPFTSVVGGFAAQRGLLSRGADFVLVGTAAGVAAPALVLAGAPALVASGQAIYATAQTAARYAILRAAITGSASLGARMAGGQVARDFSVISLTTTARIAQATRQAQEALALAARASTRGGPPQPPVP